MVFVVSVNSLFLRIFQGVIWIMDSQSVVVFFVLAPTSRQCTGNSIYSLQLSSRISSSLPNRGIVFFVAFISDKYNNEKRGETDILKYFH